MHDAATIRDAEQKILEFMRVNHHELVHGDLALASEAKVGIFLEREDLQILFRSVLFNSFHSSFHALARNNVGKHERTIALENKCALHSARNIQARDCAEDGEDGVAPAPIEDGAPNAGEDLDGGESDAGQSCASAAESSQARLKPQHCAP